MNIYFSMAISQGVPSTSGLRATFSSRRRLGVFTFRVYEFARAFSYRQSLPPLISQGFALPASPEGKLHNAPTVHEMFIHAIVVLAGRQGLTTPGQKTTI